MSNRVKYIISVFIFIISGFALAIILLKSNFVLNIIKSIDFVSLAYWFSIILGALASALVAIFATYFTAKKQEIIKLKAKVIERNIEIVNQLIQSTKVLSTMVLQENKKKTDLEFDYECDYIDEWPISIPCVLSEEFQSSDWYVNLIMMMDTTSRIMNIEIIHYEHFIKEYFLNLYLLYDKIPIDKKWQMAFALKPDFRNISNEFINLLESYLQNDIYKMKQNKKTWDSKIEQSYREKIKKSNFFIYKKQFESLVP